jgi:hypothetical protein
VPMLALHMRLSSARTLATLSGNRCEAFVCVSEMGALGCAHVALPHLASRVREELGETLRPVTLAVRFRALEAEVTAVISPAVKTSSVLPSSISIRVVDRDKGGAVDANNVTECRLFGTLVRSCVAEDCSCLVFGAFCFCNNPPHPPPHSLP